ncbi:MAG: sigma factor-like helix-turn-helix DNA-binding protein [Halanaerobacter sp.]
MALMSREVLTGRELMKEFWELSERMMDNIVDEMKYDKIREHVIAASSALGRDMDLVYNYIKNVVDREVLLKAMGRLKGREREIIMLRSGVFRTEQRLSIEEVAAELQISESYIIELEKKAINKLYTEIKTINY